MRFQFVALQLKGLKVAGILAVETMMLSLDKFCRLERIEEGMLDAGRDEEGVSTGSRNCDGGATRIATPNIARVYWYCS
jgi:hypothetical protein